MRARVRVRARVRIRVRVVVRIRVRVRIRIRVRVGVRVRIRGRVKIRVRVGVRVRVWVRVVVGVIGEGECEREGGKQKNPTHQYQCRCQPWFGRADPCEPDTHFALFVTPRGMPCWSAWRARGTPL